jgi:hypothetical protein
MKLELLKPKVEYAKLKSMQARVCRLVAHRRSLHKGVDNRVQAKKSSPAKTPPAVNMFASLDRRSSSGRQMSDQQLVQNFARKTSSSTVPTERGRSNTRAGSQTVASGSGTVAVTHPIIQTNFAGGPAELSRSPSSSPAPVAGQRRTRQDTSSGNVSRFGASLSPLVVAAYLY